MNGKEANGKPGFLSKLGSAVKSKIKKKNGSNAPAQAPAKEKEAARTELQAYLDRQLPAFKAIAPAKPPIHRSTIPTKQPVPERPLFKRLDVPAPSEKPLQVGNFPKAIWYRIFHHLPLPDLARFARTSHASLEIFYDYGTDIGGYRALLLYEKIVPSHLILAAERAGVALKYSLLHKLSHISPATFDGLHKMPSTHFWPLAAICGDVTWLLQKLDDNLLNEFDVSDITVLEYLSFGGQSHEINYLRVNHHVSDEYLLKNQVQLIYFTALGGCEVTLNYFSTTLHFNLKQPLQRHLDKFNILNPLAAGGHIELLQFYIAEGLKIADAATRINSLFMTAANQGHFNICDYLVSHHQESPTQKNLLNQTQAHFAAQYGDASRLNRLFSEHPELKTSADNAGRLPVDFSIVGGHLKLLQQYLSKTDITNRRIGEDKDTYLHLACQGRQSHLIIPLACDFQIPVGTAGFSPLSFCGFSGAWECLEKLLTLKNPPNPLKRDLTGASIPMQAIAMGQLFFLEKFIERFGPINEEDADNQGNKISHFALRSASMFACNYLSQQYTCIRFITIYRNKQGEDPMIHAARYFDALQSLNSWPFLFEFISKNFPDKFTSPERQGLSFRDLADKNGVLYLLDDLNPIHDNTYSK